MHLPLPTGNPILTARQQYSMSKLKTVVDKKRCIASGDCVETAPSVFAFDAGGKSEVINQSGAPDGSILAAARSCPVKAITVVDQDTGVQLFPPPPKK